MQFWKQDEIQTKSKFKFIQIYHNCMLQLTNAVTIIILESIRKESKKIFPESVQMF